MFKEFGLSFAQIAELTDEQIANILLCERDQYGNKVTRPKEPQMSFREVAYKVWRLREPGVSEQELEKRFKETYGG